MAKNNDFVSRVGGWKNLVSGVVLSLFVLAGSFSITELALISSFGKSGLLLAQTSTTTVCSRTAPYTGAGNTRPDIGTARCAGMVMGVQTTSPPQSSTRVNTTCQMADLNCDGTISTEEWRKWSTYTWNQINNRCAQIKCWECSINPECAGAVPGKQIQQLSFNFDNSLVGLYGYTVTIDWATIFANTLEYSYTLGLAIPPPTIITPTYTTSGGTGLESWSYVNSSSYTISGDSIGIYGYPVTDTTLTNDLYEEVKQ